MSEDFHASNGIVLLPGGAVSRASMPRVYQEPNGVALVATAQAEALTKGYPINAASMKMDVFARNLTLTKAGLRDQYDDALDADDIETAMRLAAQVGYPWNEQERLAALACRKAPTDTGFSFTQVGGRLEQGLKPISWLIRNYLEGDTLALLFGDPASGKSFVAIDLACCIATGTPWHGNAATPGGVFYIAGEGQNGLDRRFAAWSRRNNVSLRDAPIFSSSRPAMLCTLAGAADVANAVQSLSEKSHLKPTLIIVDTLARNFGGDENSQQDMGAFIANLDAFLRKSGDWNATVLVVHHSGHADKSRGRGSSALKGAVDAEYSVAKDEAGIVRLEATKMKDAQQPEPLAFRLERVELALGEEDGEPISSCALASLDYAPPMKTGKCGRGRHQTTALGVLRDALERHRCNVAASGRDPSLARVTLETWRDLCADAGLDRRRFSEVLQSLKNIGKVLVDHGHVTLADPFA